jgi:predicted enzyme related to lactoylglutathione lyase
VPVAGLDAALVWYERLFGRPPDMRPHPGEACWRASGDGWVYVIEDANRAGHGLLTLIVEDLDAVLAGLAARGVEAGPVEPVGDHGRKAALDDPEGNRVSFAQVAAR